jgi:hypothetical protein
MCEKFFEKIALFEDEITYLYYTRAIPFAISYNCKFEHMMKKYTRNDA